MLPLGYSLLSWIVVGDVVDSSPFISGRKQAPNNSSLVANKAKTVSLVGEVEKVSKPNKYINL